MNLNYIAEINAFNDWCEKHYLPIQAEYLWYKLIAKANRSKWSEWVQVDNLELMRILRTKREATAIEIRNKLIEAGLIKHIKGKKGVPNQYKIISLANLQVKTEVKTEVKNDRLSEMKANTVVESVAETAVETVAETVATNKHKQKHKRKLNNNIFIPPTLTEVQEYCNERKNNIDPKAFYDYYHASDWVDRNGNKVKNWKQKVITWEKFNQTNPKNVEKKSNDFKNPSAYVNNNWD